MKSVDVKSKTYINFSKGNNYKDPKFNVVNQVRISKFKNIFVKGFALNWSKEVLKILRREHMLLEILMKKNILEIFMKMSYKKQIKKNLE